MSDYLSYFTDRKQRVKLGDCLSDWRQILKGASQGSLFGPFMYNVFSNDLLFILDKPNDISVYIMLMILQLHVAM